MHGALLCHSQSPYAVCIRLDLYHSPLSWRRVVGMKMTHGGPQPGQERGLHGPLRKPFAAVSAVLRPPPIENTSGQPLITDMSIRPGLVLQGDVCEVKIMVGKTACNFYPGTSVIFTDMSIRTGLNFTDVLCNFYFYRGTLCKTSPGRIGL